jgi:hypothetical protein
VTATAATRGGVDLHRVTTPIAPTHSTHILGAPAVCRLAFNYLEELLKEFNTKFRDEVESASRPYAFIKFGAPPALTPVPQTQPPTQTRTHPPIPLPLPLPLPLPSPLPLTCCRADTFIQRTKKLYVDTRTQRNLNKLNDVRSHHPNRAITQTAPSP